METGHLESPDLTITIGYDTAKAILVDGDAQAAMQAFLGGKIKVDGDITKMIALQTAGIGAARPTRQPSSWPSACRTSPPRQLADKSATAKGRGGRRHRQRLGIAASARRPPRPSGAHLMLRHLPPHSGRGQVAEKLEQFVPISRRQDRVSSAGDDLHGRSVVGQGAGDRRRGRHRTDGVCR